MNADIGLPGKLVSYAGNNQNVRAAQVSKVHSPTLVDARQLGASSDTTSIEFVDVGGTPPAAPVPYFQAIVLA